MKTNKSLSRRPVLKVFGFGALVIFLSYCPLLVNCWGWSKPDEEDVYMDNIAESNMKENNQIDTSRKIHSGGVNHENEEPIEYGVDISFPMHHATVSENYAWLQHNTDPLYYSTPRKLKDQAIQPLPDRQRFYEDFINGCVEFYEKEGRRCLQTEQDRIAMSLRQPQSMQNYTEDGFKKIRAPEALFKSLQEFWEKNKDSQTKENWGSGNTYTNNWKAPTYMVSVEDRSLRGGGQALKKQLWDAAKNTIQEWTGEELTEVSLYGIRVYKTDAVLASHVDRLPLVSSAIVNVAADVDEPWPLEVISHSGKATNVTMVPGDMVLYESHSVIHGRPFPLKGRYVANCFIHFEPVGHSLRHNAAQEQAHDVDQKYRKAVENGVSGHENDNNGLPPYLIAGSPEEPNWRRSHPSEANKPDPFSTGSTGLHIAAQKGDLKAVMDHVDKQGKHTVNAKDANGWTPLHEATRSGHIDVVKFLLDSGADMNETTGNGASALWWAKFTHGNDHPMVEILESAGAVELGPDL